MRVQTEKHMTITEAHPNHGENGEPCFERNCPSCRAAFAEVLGITPDALLEGLRKGSINITNSSVIDAGMRMVAERKRKQWQMKRGNDE